MVVKFAAAEVVELKVLWLDELTNKEFFAKAWEVTPSAPASTLPIVAVAVGIKITPRRLEVVDVKVTPTEAAEATIPKLDEVIDANFCAEALEVSARAVAATSRGMVLEVGMVLILRITEVVLVKVATAEVVEAKVHVLEAAIKAGFCAKTMEAKANAAATIASVLLMVGPVAI